MDIRDILPGLDSAESHSPLEILVILMIALGGGLLIFFTYRLTTDAALYSFTFNICNVVIALITAVIMVMISSNIIISLGMVGALSIIRFRTAVKEARDSVYIFWSIVLGLCAGSSNFMLAAISSLFISVVCFAFSILAALGRFGQGNYTLIVHATADTEPLGIEQTVTGQLKRCKLRAASTSGESLEVVYRVRGSQKSCLQLVRQLNALPNVHRASLAEADL
jgi:hypothetical protein